MDDCGDVCVLSCSVPWLVHSPVAVSDMRFTALSLCAWRLFLLAIVVMRIRFIFYSEDLSRLAARKYARIIQKLGFPVSTVV